MSTKDDSAKKPIKVDKWDGCAVKNALDDGARKIFAEDLEFVERFYLCDIRLGLCTLAVLVALFALLWDWLYPFPVSSGMLAKCAVAYFVVTVVATLYVQFIERGIFFVGYNRDLTLKIEGSQGVLFEANIWSNLKRYDDEYSFTVQVSGTPEFISKQSAVKKAANITKTMVARVTEFVDVNGIVLVETDFKQKLFEMYNSAKNEVLAELQGASKKEK